MLTVAWAAFIIAGIGIWIRCYRNAVDARKYRELIRLHEESKKPSATPGVQPVPHHTPHPGALYGPPLQGPGHVHARHGNWQLTYRHKSTTHQIFVDGKDESDAISHAIRQHKVHPDSILDLRKV